METPPKLAARGALNCVRDLAIGRLAIPMRFPMKKQQVRTVLNWTRRTMEQQFEAEDFREAALVIEADSVEADASRPRGNWIATSRAIRNHPLVGYGQPVKPANPRKGAYSRNEAWMDLVMSAAHHETDVRLQGVIVTIKRGQVAGSLTWWATRWNWTVKQVRGFKAQLRQHAMISVSEGQTPPSEKGTRRDRLSDVITICNYEKYQTAAPPKGKGRGRPQPKKGQESNKRKNNSSPLPLSGQGDGDELAVQFEAFWRAFPEGDWKRHKADCREEFRRIVTSDECSAAELVAGATGYAARCRRQRRDYAPEAPLNWLRRRHWEDQTSNVPSAVDHDGNTLPFWEDDAAIDALEADYPLKTRAPALVRKWGGWPPDYGSTPTSGECTKLHLRIARTPGLLRELEALGIEFPSALQDMVPSSPRAGVDGRAVA